MTQYVCGFMFAEVTNRVQLIRKLRPAWQKGLLNGVGGKIEGTEMPLYAMVREWQEETGHRHDEWRVLVRLNHGENIVHFFWASVSVLPKLPTHNDVGEEFVTLNIHDIWSRHDLIPNLCWLLPMLLDRERPALSGMYLSPKVLTP